MALLSVLLSWQSCRVVIISIFSDHDPDTDRTITIVDRDLDQNKKLRSVSRSIMKFSVNLYRSRANYHWLKVLALKKLWQLKFRLLSSWNIADVFLSAKCLRKEIGKKLSLSILVSIKNFHDRIFAILIGIGIAITIFFWYRERDLDQDFLSSSVSLSRSRKTVIDDKPAILNLHS